jgi:peptidyl-prolyl cis-trans isomerase B (cyclophilin B)
MSSNRRGRRVPPKARGPRRDNLPPGDPSAAGAREPGTPAPGTPATGTRAANRAAKRATLGVRPKTVRRGHVVSRPSRRFNPAVLFLAIAAVAVGAGVLLLGNPFGTPATSPSPGPAASAGAYGDGTCPTSQPAALPAGESRLVTIETSLGNIVIKVDGALSPIAAGNFVALAACEYYDGVGFHRTASLEDGTPFVIQGGDPAGTGGGPGPGYSIQDEPVTATYHRGTVAMARTDQPNSQGSQFFIVLDDRSTGPLTSINTYAIFGEVVSGMEVADAIFQASAGQQLPPDPIVMTRVTVAEAPAASPGGTGSPAPAASAPANTPAPSPAPTT